MRTHSVSLLVLGFLLFLTSPAFSAALPEKLSPEFHKNRLEELYRRCPNGLILLRGELDWFRKRELRQFDSSYSDPDFKQERNLYYLTGIEVPNSFVLIDAKKKEVRLYSDWKGEYELQQAKRLDYVKGPFPADRFLYDVLQLTPDYEKLYTLYIPILESGTLHGKTAALTGVFPPGMPNPLTEEMQFARGLAEIFPSQRINSLASILAEMQKVKQPEEIRLLRRANEIAAHAVVEAMKSIRPGLHDHDIRAVIDYTFKRDGGVGATFANNVMSGPNMFSNLLPLWSDYYHRDRQLGAGEGTFIDIGTEVGYYVSDIGRTAPVSGKFTAEQRKLYDIYLPCFLKAEQSIRPGATQHNLVEITAQCAESQLPGLGDPYRISVQEWIKSLRSHTTLGHYQDLNVLGVGAGDDEPLMAGMVFAIEPVLYSKELNFAVFIEDVILVTENGYDVLSKGMPYTSAEVEKIMAQPGIVQAEEARRPH
ncbi:MAG TPA: aminopeptidase P N-terminal domain-containing protein [Candidatus Dormibacteraeota bacterium]|nr:aminopeptidase P N-terminal domain-containing protein [Candidatus Dormibacteraeota bacterium]